MHRHNSGHASSNLYTTKADLLEVKTDGQRECLACSEEVRSTMWPRTASWRGSSCWITPRSSSTSSQTLLALTVWRKWPKSWTYRRSVDSCVDGQIASVADLVGDWIASHTSSSLVPSKCGRTSVRSCTYACMVIQNTVWWCGQLNTFH